MEDEPQVAKPVVDRWSEGAAVTRREATGALGDLPIFRLSGGLMRSGRRRGDEIDELLEQIMPLPSSGRYNSNVDKNLDFVFTYLQLDVINAVAESCIKGACREDDRPERADPNDLSQEEI